MVVGGINMKTENVYTSQILVPKRDRNTIPLNMHTEKNFQQCINKFIYLRCIMQFSTIKKLKKQRLLLKTSGVIGRQIVVKRVVSHINIKNTAIAIILSWKRIISRFLSVPSAERNRYLSDQIKPATQNGLFTW